MLSLRCNNAFRSLTRYNEFNGAIVVLKHMVKLWANSIRDEHWHLDFLNATSQAIDLGTINELHPIVKLDSLRRQIFPVLTMLVSGEAGNHSCLRNRENIALVVCLS